MDELDYLVKINGIIRGIYIKKTSVASLMMVCGWEEVEGLNHNILLE